MNAQHQETQQQSHEEFEWELPVSDLTTISMQSGRRHGLGSKALEFKHLPRKQRRDRLEVLMDFIRKANDKRSQQGENPNMHRDLSREFDQQHPELPTPSATDVQKKSAPTGEPMKLQTPKTRAEQYPHNRKALADYILQPTEEEYAGPDFIARGFRYLIGENASGQGVALAWCQSRKSKPGQVLTHRILNAVLDEAKMAGFTLPIHIHASASTAPITEDLYHFHQLCHSTMVRRLLAEEKRKAYLEKQQSEKASMDMEMDELFGTEK